MTKPSLPSPATVPDFARRLPFFYGWLIVGVVMLSGFLGAGVNNITMGVIFKPLTEDLGWSRSLTAGAIAAGTIAGGLLATLMGRLADRIGPRLLIPLGAGSVGTLALVLALISEPWHFYALYIPARALAQTMLFGVVPMTAITNWFRLRRPRAIGMLTMAVPMGSAVLALAVQAIINEFDWRTAFVLLGALLWVLVVVPGALLLRRQPEDLGLRPDGAPPPLAQGPALAGHPRPQPASGEYSWTFRAALRTPALWLLIGGSTLAIVSTGAIAFHLVAYYTDMAIDPTLAAGALSLFAFSGGLANGMWGFLAERRSPQMLYMVSLAVAAIGSVLLLQVQAPLLGYAVALLLGVAARGQEALLQILLATYYGRRAFGAISGVLEVTARAGLGVGPLIAAAIFDLTGSYHAAFGLFAGAFLLAAVLIALARRPAIPA